MTCVRVEPSGPVRGVVRVPGSKSHTNRALICSALAGGGELVGASDSDDTRVLREALSRGGPGEYHFGNAGTSLRFFTAYATLGRGRFVIDGDERMRERPIGGLVTALRELGARIEYAGREGCPPLVVHAGGLAGGRCAVRDDTSSQFVSAILLAAPYAAKPVTIEVGRVPSWPYVQLTLEVMRGFGVSVGEDLRVPTAKYVPRRLEIEPDPAAANYFLAAAHVTGGQVSLPGYRRGFGEGRFLDILESGSRDVDMNDCPDSAQTYAVVSLFAKQPTRIRNVRNLRVKETDRIAALAKELRKLGARVEELEDGLVIEPGRLQGATIETYNDHRMAMSFAIAGLVIPGIEIRNPGCVSKSFPRFFETLESLGVKVTRV